MQETHYPDGRIEREFVSADTQDELDRKLAKMHETALRNGAVAVTQRKVGRNHPCPCGSGQKFKRCCARLLNTGVAVVA